VFLLGLVLVMMIIAGARALHYGSGVVGGLAALYLAAIAFFPHVVNRFEKHSDPQPGDQVYQAVLALGAGGFAGMDGGAGAGVGKLGYVPMIQSDFIMAAVGEETGFLGCSVVIALFVMLTYAGARIACAQRERFRFLLACGLVINIAVQAIINLVVVTALGPTKGIALPFISSGGSALMFSLFGVGLLLNIARSRAVESAESDRYATDAETESESGDSFVPVRRPQPARAATREKVVI
jgi:cell division protein FtsW